MIGANMMELRKITDECYYFHSPVNVGYIKKGETGVLVDAGLDASAAKKILRQIQERNWPLTHLFITHAHADHFGGAHLLQKRNDIHTVAPKIEADVLTFPKWEPLYLFQGNEPPETLRTKFIEGKAVRIDQVCEAGTLQLGEVSMDCHLLDGHSENQMGLIYEEICYAADSYMSLDYLDKHGVPFLVDLSRTFTSLNKLLNLPVKGAVPGHGIYETNFKETVGNNIRFHNDNLRRVEAIFEKAPLGMSYETSIQLICDEWKIELRSLGTWALYRTAITSYLQHLCQQGRLLMQINRNRLWFKRVQADGRGKIDE